jgi:hypothetical protein
MQACSLESLRTFFSTFCHVFSTPSVDNQIKLVSHNNQSYTLGMSAQASQPQSKNAARRKRNKKKKAAPATEKAAAQAAAAPEPAKPVDPAKRAKNLRKKLKQIEELAAKVAGGADISAAQQKKLDSKAEYKKELAEMEALL